MGEGFREEAGGLREKLRKVSLGSWGTWVATLFTPVLSFQRESWGEVPITSFS